MDPPAWVEEQHKQLPGSPASWDRGLALAGEEFQEQSSVLGSWGAARHGCKSRGNPQPLCPAAGHGGSSLEGLGDAKCVQAALEPSFRQCPGTRHCPSLGGASAPSEPSLSQAGSLCPLQLLTGPRSSLLGEKPAVGQAGAQVGQEHLRNSSTALAFPKLLLVHLHSPAPQPFLPQ